MSSVHAPLDRRELVLGAGGALAGAALLGRGGARVTHGPFRCDTSAEEFGLWARVSEPGVYELDVGAKGAAVAAAEVQSDLTLHWSMPGVRGARNIVQAVIRRDGREIWRGLTGRPKHVLGTDRGFVALGSCADERKFADQPVWRWMLGQVPDLVVLLGDTPYIDSTDLAQQRARYASFYEQPELAELLRHVPFAGTWDDHDYASNDRFGAVEGRENARRAFLENHGGGAWGANGQGIFTKRRVGDMELFLLDTRWFADTEASPFDAARRTLLGAAQWRWLQQELLASTAPFKILCSGMIWNEATRPGKVDHWGHWAHERDALFEWLGRKRIFGVLLVGGDIHRTRVVRHATRETVGYDVLELITSPLANTVIETANASHPGLVFDAGVEMSYVELRAFADASGGLGAQHEIRARFVDAAGAEMHALARSLSDLTRP
jgi:alkaline phosphatase D